MFFKKKSNMKFPNDADGDALKRLYEDNVDFSKAHSIDFFIAVPDHNSGEKILELVKENGFDCSLEKDNETDEWTCYCTKTMLLEYEQIIETQNLLDKLSKPLGGYSDGWGTFGD